MNNSILLIQSQQANNTSMGTGFVVHQDSFGSYVVTCAHVVTQVKKVKIENFEVEVIIKGSLETIDLAVLYVKGLFRTPLELQDKECESKEVELIGYSIFSKEKYQVKTRAATILTKKMKLTNIKDNQAVSAWQIIAEDNNEIEPGNSGAPLFCKKTKKVMAVVSNRKSVHRGYALSIENLKDIWLDMPPLLLEGNDASPFVGLSAFSIEDAHLFFGREKESTKIIEKLKKQDLVAVVGDSGSGKSSVIKAGVIPKYLNGVLNTNKESKRVFHLIEMRPATNPFNELSNALNRIDEIFNFEPKYMGYLKKVLKAKDAGDILNAFESLFRKEEVTLLLYIDQFEEIFTMYKNNLPKEFITFLLYLLENQSSKLKIKIIFTMRRDYYNLIAEYESFFKRTQESKYTLRRMKNEQIKECIEKPLEKTSIAIEQIGVFSKAVLQDMGDESSELTLLQIALTQTWKHKGEYNNNLLSTYHEIGEVSGALAKLADDTWKILSAEEQKTLQYIFIRIIKSNETGGVTRRLAKKNEFSDEAWILAQKLSSALDYEGSAASEKNAQLGRLLKIKGEQGKVLELTHEALIKQWPKYQVWLKKVSKDDLKRTHDYVINQNQIYWKNGKKRKFLLRGYELERSEKLLGEEYQEYLSEDEVSYIKKGVWYRKLGWGFLGLVVSVILGLAGILVYANEKLHESNMANKVISNKLVLFTDKVVEHIIKTPKIKRSYTLEYTIFDYIVKDFKSNKKIAITVAKAWYGKGLVLRNENKIKKAIKTYKEFIEYYKESRNPKVLWYVIRAWYDMGKVLEKEDNERSYQVYSKLIEFFKNFENSKIREEVAKSWLNKGLLFDSTISERNESIQVLENFLEHFKESKNSLILKQKLEGYNTLSMLKLLNNLPKDAINDIKKGYKIRQDYILLDLNLFNAYILLGKLDDAKEIYMKNKHKNIFNLKWEDAVSEDIKLFQENNIDSIYFDEVLNFYKEN